MEQGSLRHGWKNGYFKYFSLENNDIVVDFGASGGDFASMCMEIGTAKCYSFEAQKKFYNALEKNTKSWNQELGYEAFYAFTKAIVGQDSEKIKKMNSEGLECIVPLQRGIDSPEEIIETISFMDFIKENKISKIDFFKMDIEGSEYSILSDKESLDFILNNTEKVVIEFHLHYLRDILGDSPQVAVEKTNKIVDEFENNGFRTICSPRDPHTAIKSADRPTFGTYCMDFWAWKNIGEKGEIK